MITETRVHVRMQNKADITHAIGLNHCPRPCEEGANGMDPAADPVGLRLAAPT